MRDEVTMWVVLDTTRYGMDPSDEQIADSAEQHGLFLTRDEAVQVAETLPVPPEKIMLVEIECEKGEIQ